MWMCLQSARGSRGSKTEVHVEMARACQCELDMTIVDRIHSLINRLPLATPAKPALNPSIYHVLYTFHRNCKKSKVVEN